MPQPQSFTAHSAIAPGRSIIKFMETLLTKAAEQVPNLAVLSFIVWMFLKHLASQNKDNAERAVEQAKVLANLNLEAHAVSRAAQEVIKANTIAATTNTAALNETSLKLVNLINAVENKKLHL